MTKCGHKLYFTVSITDTIEILYPYNMFVDTITVFFKVIYLLVLILLNILHLCNSGIYS